jgi:RND family efflux transporter MFP subunit
MVTSSKSRTAFLTAAAVLASSIGCRHEKKAERVPTPVRVETVSTAGLAGGVRYSANVQPNQQVVLLFKSSGYVREIRKVNAGEGHLRNLQGGDSVSRGAVLARVREADYVEKVNQARASLAEATASLTREKLDFDRSNALFQTKSLAKADLDRSRSSFDTAEARVSGAKAQLEAARIALADTALVAPMNSLVLSRSVEEGSLVSAGTQGFTLADLSSVKAVFGVPDLVVQHLSIGQPLSVSVEAIPAARFAGRITAIAPSAEQKSRVFDVEVTIPNGDGRLRSGMIASVETPRVANVVPSAEPAVPLTAIVQAPGESEGYAVFVLEGNGENATARLHKVSLGEVVGNRIAVPSGLKAGDRVVVTGGTIVADGDRVRVIP